MFCKPCSRAFFKIRLSRQELVVSQEDVEREVARAAESMAFRHMKESPMSLLGWNKYQRRTNSDRVLSHRYRAARRFEKALGPVPVTQDDLDKAFTATFGPRVRCRAVVLDNQRQTQEVWQIARQNPTTEV